MARPNRFQSYVLLPFARRLMIAAAGVAFIVALGALAIGGLLYARGLYSPSPSEPSPINVRSDQLLDKNGFPPELEMTLVNVSRQRLSGSIVVARITSAHDLDPMQSLTLVDVPNRAGFKLEASEGQDQRESSQELKERGATFSLSLTDAKADEIRNSRTGSFELVTVDAVFNRPEGRLIVRRVLELDFRDAEERSEVDRGPQDEGRSSSTEAKTEAATDVEWVAQEIALMVDPVRSPKFFRAYSEGIELVRSCTPDVLAYAAMLRREITKSRSKLGKATILRLVNRACGLWRAEELRVNRERAESLMAAQQGAAQAMMSKASALIAMYVAGCALIAFLMFAIMLAILAIENHALTLRTKSNEE